MLVNREQRKHTCTLCIWCAEPFWGQLGGNLHNSYAGSISAILQPGAAAVACAAVKPLSVAIKSADARPTEDKQVPTPMAHRCRCTATILWW